MAYSLRSRRVRDVLLEEEEAEHLDDPLSDEEEDHLSEQSEYSDEFSNEGSDDEFDMEVEDATANARTLESRARGRPKNKLKGKNGYAWNTKVPERRSDRLIPDQSFEYPGPKGAASELQTMFEFWNILFSDEILKIIVDRTNEQIEAACLKLIQQEKELQSYHHHIDESELKALIAVFYYSGLWKSSGVNYEQLWSGQNGISFYRCVMGKARFMFLCTCLRFDDKSKRNRDDRFCLVREIWDIFMRNCRNNYEPSKFCTVDEQLLGFRGRCIFRMYIKSKPDKYGLKIITLNDAETSYMIYGLPYLGKTALEDKSESISEYFFREVTAPVHNTNRTVTCDNWFTSIPLMERMQNEPFNMTITGTIRKNKREIPAEMKVAGSDPPETKFCFSSSNITLLSHTPKKHKIVLLASSFSHSTIIVDGKPEIIIHYNGTKGGTDCFDKLCHSFTTSRKTNRWPMRIFYGMLDQAAVNARILLTCQNRRKGIHKTLTAQECLRNLVLELARPHLEERLTLSTLRVSLKHGIMSVLKRDPPPGGLNDERQRLEKQKRCQICKKGADKKTTSVCPSFQRAMCDKHRAYMCVECAGDE